MLLNLSLLVRRTKEINIEDASAASYDFASQNSSLRSSDNQTPSARAHFARIDDVHLRACDGGGNEILLDGIRMDAVVDLRELPLCRPADLFLFLGL